MKVIRATIILLFRRRTWADIQSSRAAGASTEVDWLPPAALEDDGWVAKKSVCLSVWVAGRVRFVTEALTMSWLRGAFAVTTSSLRTKEIHANYIRNLNELPPILHFVLLISGLPCTIILLLAIFIVDNRARAASCFVVSSSRGFS